MERKGKISEEKFRNPSSQVPDALAAILYTCYLGYNPKIAIGETLTAFSIIRSAYTGERC
jgi:hypothetical protein